MTLKKGTKQTQVQATPKSNVATNKLIANKSWSSKAWFIGLLLVLVITFVVFIPALSGEFVSMDDGLYIESNRLLDSLSLANIRQIFTTLTANSVYCPLVITSFAIEKQLFGLNPFVYHFDNIFLHLICVALVFRLMSLLKLRLEAAFLVALLFGIHTMRVESVAWVSERKDVLFGAFYLASMVLYVLSRERPQKRTAYLIASILLFIPSLFSKIQAVSLPLSLLCIDYLRGDITNVKTFLSESFKKTPYFILSLSIGLLGIYFLKEAQLLNVSNHFPAYYRPFFAAYTLIVYLAKFVLPLPQFLSAIYSYPDTLSTIYYLSPILLISIIVGVYISTKYTRIILFGFLFFFVNVVFVVQLVGAGQAYLADRFTYIPYLGLFMIWGYGLQYIMDKKKSYNFIVIGILGVYFLLLFTFTYKRNSVWQNSELLWTDVLNKSASWSVAYINRGYYYHLKGQLAKAISDYTKASDLNPNLFEAYYNRGTLYFDNNEPDKAWPDLNKALTFRSDTNGNYQIYYLLSKIYFDKGELDKALLNLDKVISLQPNDKVIPAYSGRAGVYFMKNQIDLALADINKALELDSTYTEAYLNRGVCYNSIKKYNEAITDFNRYLSVTTNNPQAYSLLADSYYAIGKFTESVANLDKAIALNNSSGLYYYNRYLAYAKLGNAVQAQSDLQRSQQLGYKP